MSGSRKNLGMLRDDKHSDRDIFIQQINEYKTQAKFAPLCIGFYRMSGTIGKRRAKRATHLLTHASEEGVNFIIYILSKLSAPTLLGYMQTNEKYKAAIAYVKDAIDKNQLLRLSNFHLTVEVFINFLNVINYPGEKFKDVINDIIRDFSFAELKNDTSPLVKSILMLHEQMSAELRVQQVSSHHSRGM